MKDIFIIAKHNLKIFFSNSFSIALLIAPIFVTVLLMAMLSGNKFSSGAVVGIVMPEKVTGGNVLLSELRKGLSLVYLDAETAAARLEQKKINGIVIIHTDNLLKDLGDARESLEIISIAGDPVIGYITAQLDLALDKVNTFNRLSGVDEKEFERLYQEYRDEIKEVRIDNADFEVIKSTMVFGMFVMVFLFTCIKGLQIMMQEKESKVYERICMTPIKRPAYILGHILGAFGILMIQIVIQAIVMNRFNLTFGLGLMAFIGICMVLGVAGISISLMIVACSKNTQTYFITGSFVISPLCMLSDCIFPKEFLPEIVNRISLLSPIRWVMILYKDVMLGGDIKQITASILLALGLSVVIVLLGMIIESSKKVV
ncbi:MAG: Multidrug transporter, permease [Clostridia bacterium]|jgi:ABC-2 type transport system permease protein|nr:Multidrug transporter, permease [Clostridia bacterium]